MQTTHQKRIRNVSPELTQVARSLRDEMTNAEAVLWEALRNRRLDGLRFRAQHAVETFVFDFYCSACKLIVEVDGGIHVQDGVAEQDRLRDEHVIAHGYHVVRVTNQEVQNDLPRVLDRIQTAALSLQKKRNEKRETAP